MALSVEEAQAHVPHRTGRAQLVSVLRRRHIARLAQQWRGLQAADPHQRDRHLRKQLHDPLDGRIVSQLLRGRGRPKDRRGGQEDRLGTGVTRQEVDQPGGLDLDLGVAHAAEELNHLGGHWHAEGCELLHRRQPGRTPGGQADHVPTRQGGLQVGRRRRGQGSTNLRLPLTGVDDDALGQSVALLHGLFQHRVGPLRRRDNGAYNTLGNSALEQAGHARLRAAPWHAPSHGWRAGGTREAARHGARRRYRSASSPARGTSWRYAP